MPSAFADAALRERVCMILGMLCVQISSQRGTQMVEYGGLQDSRNQNTVIIEAERKNIVQKS